MNMNEHKTGRKCSICTHERAEYINKNILKGSSFRAISRQFCGNDSMRDALRRHSENCLDVDVRAVIRESIEKGKALAVVDVHAEFFEQLTFVKKMRLAVINELTDDETGKFTLEPRLNEISVVYEDHADKKPNGEPKRKRRSLDLLLKEIAAQKEEFSVESATIKSTDIRKFALDVIDACNAAIEQFAKLQGLYKKDFNLNVNSNAALTDAMKIYFNTMFSIWRKIKELPPEDIPLELQNIEEKTEYIIQRIAKITNINVDELTKAVTM